MLFYTSDTEGYTQYIHYIHTHHSGQKSTLHKKEDSVEI